MIISNTSNFEKIHVQFPQEGEIRKVLSDLIKPLQNDGIIVLKAVCVGRRILNDYAQVSDIVKLIDNRRLRIYFAIKKNNKIHISFGWHKIKKLSITEKKFIKENWNIDLFDSDKRLISKSGGVLFLESLIYRYQ